MAKVVRKKARPKKASNSDLARVNEQRAELRRLLNAQKARRALALALSRKTYAADRATRNAVASMAEVVGLWVCDRATVKALEDENKQLRATNGSLRGRLDFLETERVPETV
jgi:hypothetical protein